MFSNIKLLNYHLLIILVLNIQLLSAQSINQKALNDAVSNLKLRSLGPALMGGRISDIEISPLDPSTWYVSAGSGGLWKTTNRGTTWKPIFDKYSSYSIGTVTIDPNNPMVVWLGAGENVSGRHVGWGDGIYCSRDGGTTWMNMGLKRSEHIGKILVDPRNSNRIFVAAEGPLWSSGGDRGLYKSKDSGKTWDLVLKIDENTGVTDVEFDPTNPDVIYAAAYQRRRHVWSLLGGGPSSGIYKSTDNGVTWQQVKAGLPKGDMGKIGLAVTAADPNIVYATIEANDKEKGFYRSIDKGESWVKMNSYISGGTGPHYYQEIEASPENPDLVYQMDVFFHVTRDGGKTFDYLGTGREKHSDNHALWIDPKDGKHLIAGTDAGLYETYDEGTTWRHFPNMPISQFYKLSLDNSEPFYNIVGGAQDLGTLIGPSRTMNVEGIRNQDWYVPLGADGYDTAFDPEDPNTVYMEIQEGVLHRHDRLSEEGINIQPQPEPNDPPERWNWDSPILISPHKKERLYFGSQRLWRSEDRGNSWTAISGDLTTNTNRYELEMIGKVWSSDALYDNGAMSKYATLTSIAESPLVEGLLYTGSDDGIMYVSEDGGKNWRKSGSWPEVPERSFINDIEASSHDANTVFVAIDAHKIGEYQPFLFMSTDRGRTWKSIVGDLPKINIVWVIKQDHVDSHLLFIGTEFGLYFSPNMGQNWIKLGGDVPTISFRDIELHSRDNDIVGATFGRGFYVLDDYSPLRDMARVANAQTNTLFSVRDAWWYIPNEPMQAKGMPTLGSTNFVSDNPPFGALFTYYIHDLPQTAKSLREQKEKDLNQKNSSIAFPGWERLGDERLQNEPKLMLLVINSKGDPVRWIDAPAKKGVQRINWDLRFSPPHPINLTKPAFVPPWVGEAQGPLVAPGEYSAQLYLLFNGEMNTIGESQVFNVKAVPTAAKDTDFNEVAAFQQRTSELFRKTSIASNELGEVRNRLRYMRQALLATAQASPALFVKLDELQLRLAKLQESLSGDPIRQQFNESSSPSIRARISQVIYGHWNTRQTPTETHRRNIQLAEEAYVLFGAELSSYFDEVSNYEKSLTEAGAPWTPGRRSE